MIEWWEWLLIWFWLVFAYWIGYIKAFERAGAWLKDRWSKVKLRDRYDDLKTKLDMAYESETELRDRLRDRLRAYFEHNVEFIDNVMFYDKPMLENKITIDKDMRLIICAWSHHTLNAFYTDLVDDWKDRLPLMAKGLLGYKVMDDWWVYFAGELYKTGDMIRHESDKPKTVKEPSSAASTRLAAAEQEAVEQIPPTDVVGESTIQGD